tara:strand:- start:29 stop:958 length:930 start_codon:yes stop_codon:yes gene_type:complete
MDVKNQIETKKQAYESEKSDLRDMKDILSKLKAEDQAVQFTLHEVTEENETYERQVVNSPERIRDELREMEEDLRRLRASNVSDESLKNTKEHRVTEIEKSIKTMTKVLSLMETAINDMMQYKNVKNNITETKDNIASMNSEVVELNTLKTLKEREITQMKDKIVKLSKTRKLKEDTAYQTLDQAQREYDCMLQSRNDVTEEENTVREEIGDIKRLNEKVADEFITERDHVVNTYNDLQNSVTKYHDRLFGIAITNQEIGGATPGKRHSLSDSLFGNTSVGDDSYLNENQTPGAPYVRHSMSMAVPMSE